MNTPSRNAIRSVACPHCGAPADQPCVGLRGPRDGHHGERVAEAARNANGPTGRNYDHPAPSCTRCDSTGQMLVSQNVEPQHRNTRPTPEHVEAWYAGGTWDDVTVPAGHTVVRRYTPCTECAR